MHFPVHFVPPTNRRLELKQNTRPFNCLKRPLLFFNKNNISALLILLSNSSKPMKHKGICFLLWHRPEKNASAGFHRYINSFIL
jgi:hypothetical protein